MVMVGSARRLSLQFAAAAVVLNAVSLLLRLVNLAMGHSVADADRPGWAHLPGLSALSTDFEANVPTWFTASLLVLCAAACRGAGLLSSTRDGRQGRVWTLLAIGCAAASLDELLKVHERLEPHARQALDQGSPLMVVALSGAAVVLVALSVVGVRLLHRLPRTTRRLVALAGAIYLGAVLGLDAVNGWLADLLTVDSVSYILVSSSEELLEMLAVTLLFFAASSHAAALGRAPASTQCVEAPHQPVSR
ncbi:hypothetical protein SAMN06893096_11319 [Geodermatophilus pulveris]|uniref:Uncharacterized protein n=1 Tax=Geodermatophilus pulveris TaxID=1564159 RepID=A0A239J7K6_9ACTN|nr:hypothetical protein [Geodermatophilus pulveris]SNT01478.1 hypothetical protein SAMN06893096_11319 [Geodermatophilus pulveris]